jgi:hypothetical protein
MEMGAFFLDEMILLGIFYYGIDFQWPWGPFFLPDFWMIDEKQRGS